MTTRFKVFIFALLLTLAAGSVARAQDPPGIVGGELVALNIQVTLSRYQGDELISSLPYLLSVTANTIPSSGSLRMGADVPVQRIAPIVGADGQPLPGVPRGGGPVEYRSVGTNIDCRVNRVGDDRYQVRVDIEESSVYGDEQTSVDDFKVLGLPVLRSFQSSNTLLLRDGQTKQYTAAADRITGESVRVDVTLTVLE